jgi:tetratricopeptide (TPR) repeat protein
VRVILSEAKDRFRAKAVEQPRGKAIPQSLRSFRMTRVIAALAMTGVVVALVLTASTQRHSDRHRSRAAAVQQQTDAALSESEIRDRDIAFYERRAAEDTASALDRSQLATLYMERARATGAFTDYQRAEKLARWSLAIRTTRNGGTFGLLASALLARHEFTQALGVAQWADSVDPGVPAHVALLGEIELEMGDYDAAAAHFSSLRLDRDQFTIAARVARWRELTGHADAARRLLHVAVSRVAKRDDLPREQVSWFHYRLAELELRTGNLDSAEASYRRGLKIFPDDYRILGGLARLAAARGDWQTAVGYGNDAIAIQLDPATLGTISEAYGAMGDTAQAAQYARAMTASALKQPGPIHRAWGLFLLDHGTKSDAKRVLAKTRVEIRTRRDVYGYDLLAWALHKQGREREAREAMQHALSQQTEDAQLYYHAGMIERALGNTTQARTYLDKALTMNPRFSATQASIARAALDSLGGRGHV